ncbi:hypothetical protein NR798_31990 [Archangium gephyra]|uniref:hypothetical protein n=1 Tax=Archangium gephyra TaxID=48 RepID=UPI0035D47EE3
MTFPRRPTKAVMLKQCYVLFVLLCVSCSTLAFGSTTTVIDYASTGASPISCDGFRDGVAIGGFEHKSVIGGVSTQGGVLHMEYATPGSYDYGVALGIKYPFKKNHRYTVKINAKDSKAFAANIDVHVRSGPGTPPSSYPTCGKATGVRSYWQSGENFEVSDLLWHAPGDYQDITLLSSVLIPDYFDSWGLVIIVRGEGSDWSFYDGAVSIRSVTIIEH